MSITPEKLISKLTGNPARNYNYIRLRIPGVDKPFDFNTLKIIPIIPDNVGYDGEGEVLNIVASPQTGKIKPFPPNLMKRL